MKHTSIFLKVACRRSIVLLCKLAILLLLRELQATASGFGLKAVKVLSPR